MRRLSPYLALLALPLAPLPALAQEHAEPRCDIIRPAFPPELSGWSTRSALAAGKSTRSAPVMVVGRGIDLRLAAAGSVTPPVTPKKLAEAGDTAGLALFQITRAGTYRVALGGPAWIDVVRAGKALPSTAHAHGPMCTGIRKIVDFRLRPGRYVLQLTGTQAPTIPVLIAHAGRAA